LTNPKKRAKIVLNKIPKRIFKKMMEMLDEYYLIQKVKERLDYKESDLIEVSLDEL
jgi:hypothetical protein